MIRLLLVDLDNTLFRTRSMPREVVRPAVDAVRAANVGPAALPAEAIDRFLHDCWQRPFDVAAREHGVPEALREAFGAALVGLRVGVPLTPYPDVAALAAIPATRVLVTTGYRRFQESKVEALGVAWLFDRVVVDAVGEPGREGKAGAFRRLLGEYGLAPGEALVVGDSAESEIAAGLAVGIPTVQVLRPGVARTDAARFHVRGLDELRDVVAALGGSAPALPATG